MQHKKILIGALVLALLLGGTYMYAEGDALQGRFGSVKTSTTVKTTTTSTTSSSTVTKPDFYFDGDVSYDSGNNYFAVTVCQTNVASTDVKQTSLKFAVARGQQATVQFTPTATTAESCKTVNSGDLLSTLLINTSGSYDVTATLDTTSVHTEASESNNSLATTGVVTASSYYLYDSSDLPDIFVNDMEYDSNIRRVSLNLCGVGDALLAYPSKSLVVTYSISQNGSVLVDNDSTLSSPFSGATGTRDCKTFYIMSGGDTGYQNIETGTITMGVQVDVMDTTPESDEDNNGFSQSFTQEVSL